jgi:hypothetical protein
VKSLWQEATRRSLLERAHRLTPESRPRWGTFTVDRMLAHLVDAFRMIFGEIETKPKRVRLPIPLHRWPFNVLFVYIVGMPKHAPAPKGLIERPPRGIDEELRALDDAMARFASMRGQRDWPRHPYFGKLSTRTWGVLGYRHMDHHLRQFGV